VNMKNPTEVSLTPNPTMAETLYAQRLAAGQAPMPEEGDPAYTPGVHKALAAATEQRDQSALLTQMSASVVPRNSKRQPVAVLEITDAEISLAEYLEVDLTASVEMLVARVKEDAGNLLLTEIRIGLRLAALKAKTEHGEFEERLSDIGVGERDARRAMQTARAYAAEGDARRRQQIMEMGKTKGVALLMANPEVRELILSNPDLAQAAVESTKREMAHLLKEKEALIERKDKAYADLEVQLETRSRELQKLSRLDPAALFTRSVRAEAVANAAALGEVCENLIRLAEAVNDESIAAEQRSLRRRAVGMAMGTALAHLQALYEALEGDLGEGIPAPTVLDDLTHEEQILAVKCLTHMQVQFSHRVAQRREEAYDEHLAEGGQKRRGRPPKKGGCDGRRPY